MLGRTRMPGDKSMSSQRGGGAEETYEDQEDRCSKSEEESWDCSTGGHGESLRVREGALETDMSCGLCTTCK